MATFALVVKPMGTAIKCHALDVNTTTLKAYLGNALSKTLTYGTTFGSVIALSLEKSSKNIKAYKHIPDKHDLNVFSIHYMTLASRLQRSVFPNNVNKTQW